MIKVIYDENGRHEITLSASEIETLRQGQAESVRLLRNIQLELSDWTQVPDGTANKSAWTTYRQALRELPAQDGFPENIQWPVPPA
jgi:hypothetical protein